ncbi:hypothetical protein L1887_28229 [Cichorium endivia]|nr:hypothetical protein L1887_28229 [Cichorium endivia]
MPPRRNRPPNDVHEHALEQRLMARMDERLDQVVDQLTDRMVELMNRGRQGPQTHSQMDDDDLENPFGDNDDSSFEGNLEGRRRHERGVDNRRWEARMRVDIPEFDGVSLNPEGFID